MKLFYATSSSKPGLSICVHGLGTEGLTTLILERSHELYSLKIQARMLFSFAISSNSKLTLLASAQGLKAKG